MNVKSIVKKTGFALKKASPTIMLVGGIAGGVTATVLACKATLKVDAVLDEAQEKVKKIHQVKNDPKYAGVYTEKDAHKDLVVTYGKTVCGLAKLYGPALIVGGLSVGCILGSHKMMTKRVAALGATCTLLGESLKRYRSAVSEKYGEEAEHDIYYGLSNEKVEEVVTTEDGKEKKTKVEVKVVDDAKIISPYAVFFDKSNPHYIKDDPVANADFLTQVQDWLTDKLRLQGWLFLNDARMALGYKPIPEGQVIGWIYNEKDPNCACRVDIGIDHDGRQAVRDFKNGNEKVFVIDFNVDGPILDTFHLFDKSHKVA